MNLYIHPSVERKLRDKHKASPVEVFECFQNKVAGSLIDDRAENRTFPPTRWFIAETDSGRRLKVVFIFDKKVRQFVLKTAYEPNQIEEQIYAKEFPR